MIKSMTRHAVLRWAEFAELSWAALFRLFHSALAARRQ
jgi:hypothetical protein